MNKLKMKLLHKNATVPTRSTSGSVGYDINACLDRRIEISPGTTMLISSGFSIELEHGYAAFIYARSGLGIKNGIVPANCVGVVDSDYRGEVIVGLRNNSEKPFIIENGDRIAQMVITRCELPEIELCDALDSTVRGSMGLGSSGVEPKAIE